MARVAVVTGSNKGIGLALVELLCKNHPNWVVYLTARDEGRGTAAVAELKQKGLNPAFHLLDIGSSASIEALRDDLVKNHGGLDVLVNNAAIAYKVISRSKQRVIMAYKGKLSNLPDNLMVKEWIPQNDLLAHNNTKLFITHGGISGQLEAFSNGVPILTCAVFADQIFNGRQAEKKGDHPVGIEKIVKEL